MRRRDLVLGLPLAVLGAVAWTDGVTTVRSALGAGAVEPVLSRMHDRRAGHSATLLADGQVLAIGGFVNENTPLASLESYSSATGTWTLLRDLARPRHSHTATALADGQILVAGGYADDALDSAELYGPVDRVLLQTTPMTSARSGHQAVRLPSDQVLLVGGIGTGWTFLASAELYDRATHTFSPTGGMMVSRESHTATLLADGRVLVAGGHTGRRAALRVHASVEIYDPATSSFEPAGEMIVPRHKHDAIALPDGRVMIVGGADQRDGDGAYSSTEYWNPATGSFEAGPDLLARRYKNQGTSVILSDGRVLVAGGAATVEVLDPETGGFTRTSGDLTSSRMFATATLMGDSTVLITGGYGDGVAVTDHCWLYRPA